MKRALTFSVVILFLVSSTIGCKSPVIAFDPAYFIGTWQVETSVNVTSNLKQTFAFLAGGTLKIKTPINNNQFVTGTTTWLYQSASKQVAIGTQPAYDIVEHTQNRFVWQTEGNSPQAWIRQ